MKNITKYNLLLITVLLAATSCKKSFLELAHPSQLTPEIALSTAGDLQVALRGTYAGLRRVDNLGRTFFILGDIMADNSYQSSINTNRYTLYNNYQFVVTDGDANGFWTTSYSNILRTNNIINSPIAASATVNQYKGEAYAIRALSYFNLVRYFARPFTDNPDNLGIPIVTEYNPDFKPTRSKISEVYALIIDDLNKAYSLMTTFSNSSQFSKYAAKALQAKVYLAMGDKTNAKIAALDVINNGGFTSISAANHAAYWSSVAVRTDKVETLFEVSSDAVGNNAFDALSYLYSQAGNYGDLLASDELYNLFNTGDVRLGLYPRGTRGGASVAFVNKYPVITGDLSDSKVLRLSEMYLIAAEASLPSNETDALTYVNHVTSRRAANLITSTGAQLLEDILNERRKELAFEGDRYHDIQRLKRDVTRGLNYPAAARSISYSNFRRILPIPQVEVDANPSLRTQQNPGY